MVFRVVSNNEIGARRISRRAWCRSASFPGNLWVVRILSCPLKNQRFPQGFSHFWPIALAFCSAHAGSVHGACSVVFRVAHRNSSRFSSRASRQITTGVLNVPAWYRPMSVEVVGFERPAKTQTLSTNITQRDAKSNACRYQTSKTTRK